MRNDGLNRREFHLLSAAALGGLIAGCEKPTAPPTKSSAPEPSAKPEAKPDTTVAVASTKHACRGLNECKGQGKDGKNECAGQGSCYTVSHACASHNDCKYQGGCGGIHGLNECKGKGGCQHFPIPADGWQKARDAYESRMAAAMKKFGKAPPEPAKKS